MRVITSGDLTARVSFDEEVWLQERLTIGAYFDNWESGYKYRLSRRVDTSVIADYSSANGRLFLDVADFIRDERERERGGVLFGFILAVVTAEGDKVEYLEIPIEKVVGLISPNSLHLPPFPFNVDDDEMQVIAPRKIISDFGIRSRVEFRFTTGTSYAISQTTTSGSVTPFVPMSSGSTMLLHDVSKFRIKASEETTWDGVEWNVEPITDCNLYACAEWVGATGAIKRATWHAGRITATTANDVRLVPDARPFRVIKGREDSAVLWIDGLTPYDYAYYGDICESSDVRVIFSDKGVRSSMLDASGRIDERFAVMVTTASTTPNDGNAGEFQKLEISIKTAEYDAFNL